MSQELDLSAFLSVMLKLLPLMLTTAAFASYVVIDTSLTQISQAETQRKIDEVEKGDRINLTLAITERGYTLGSADRILSGAVAVSSRSPRGLHSIPKKDGLYDVAALTDYLTKVKQSYPNEDTLIITAADAIIYDRIMEAMDAGRFKYVTKADGTRERLDLFPKVVVASRTIATIPLE